MKDWKKAYCEKTKCYKAQKEGYNGKGYGKVYVCKSLENINGMVPYIEKNCR